MWSKARSLASRQKRREFELVHRMRCEVVR